VPVEINSASRLGRIMLAGLAGALLAGCGAGTPMSAAVGASPSLPTALQLWAGFPVHASPRPIILVGGSVGGPKGVYGNEETKEALLCGDYAPPAGLPTGPSSAGGYRVISATTAFARLQPKDHTGSCATAHTLLALTGVRLGQDTYGTDRGPRILPAWLFSFAGVEGPVPVLAITSEVEWSPPGLAPGASHDIGAAVGRDHQTLTFGFLGAQFEDGPCGVRYEVQLTESPTAVMVTQISHRTSSDPNVFCTLIGVTRHASASLTAPLGARVLVNDQGYPIAAISSS
jgi:hypothetical protein